MLMFGSLVKYVSHFDVVVAWLAMACTTILKDGCFVVP